MQAAAQHCQLSFAHRNYLAAAVVAAVFVRRLPTDWSQSHSLMVSAANVPAEFCQVNCFALLLLHLQDACPPLRAATQPSHQSCNVPAEAVAKCTKYVFPFAPVAQDACAPPGAASQLAGQRCQCTSRGC
jgi:hypothetical protein